MQKKLLVASLMGSLALIALVGCSAQPTPQPDSSHESVGAALTPDEEYVRAVASCLNEDGWDVVYDPRDNSLSANPAQPDAYDAAYEECAAPLRGEIREISSWTTEEWASLYEQEGDTALCLREHGVNVPELPTLQSYIDRYTTEDSWTAYRAIGAVGQSEMYGYLRDCPQPTL
ncbi:hypothetical protein [Cryobacterium sp. Y57]|uniref:hypothetical protein n=1 Tax=Cryobacterium sp. Y57 TaxID=2048287 RepID=UPI000CE48E3E|nr:hypothetical protein [Cryobacterium sp. Y57]